MTAHPVMHRLQDNFSIRTLRAITGNKPLTETLHRHSFYYLLVIEKGAGRHEIDFVSYTVGKRSVFFIRPGQVHQLSLQPGCSGYLVTFSGSYYPATGKTSGHLLRQPNTACCIPEPAVFNKLISLLALLYQEYNCPHPENTPQAIAAYLNIILIELARQTQATQPQASYEQEQLDLFSALLEKHIAEYKQVSDYAGLLHLSTYQLNTITKKILGKTCSAVINDHIILEAKRQLLATSGQVSQIASLLGYEDVSYFIRFFKKHTGYPPGVFRENSS